MKKKVLISVSAIVIIFISLFVVNLISNGKEEQEALNRSLSTKNVNSEATEEETLEQKKKKEYEEDVKKLVASQFEYFDSIVNGDFFYQSRISQSSDNLSDGWLTEQIKKELYERALEIHQLLPEELNENDPNSQKLMQVLITINTATSSKESQRNIYNIHKTLYELNVQLNDYELEKYNSNGKENFNPVTDWVSLFGEKEDQSVKTEAELKAELAEDSDGSDENE
ncbi:hypothetical protein FS935_15995 [Metabacillus litoralis]|uniref:Uncharacterized protein n=1 Tax=Metabacillus litoralis TaxID=152268 RepID=A0A5C6W0N4_9BACI|nr:hypothetical protein [Metabacillus litoralis]TXC89860.1 hypothetical protein FS935_15995 [Metabacillus litoralis]